VSGETKAAQARHDLMRARLLRPIPEKPLRRQADDSTTTCVEPMEARNGATEDGAASGDATMDEADPITVSPSGSVPTGAACRNPVLEHVEASMMKRLAKIVFLFLGFSMTADLGFSTVMSHIENTKNQGSWYVLGHEWPHDGNPLESDNFIIFSDGASVSARKYLSEIGEETYLKLKKEFKISDQKIFKFPNSQTKIHIFAYKNHFPKDWGGKAYYGGYIIYSPDHIGRGKEGHTDPEVYSAVVKHELTHVIQNLILGRLDNTLIDVWMSEGLAETISQSNPERRIDSEKKMDELISKFGTLNPISMHIYDYPDIEGIVVEYYYPMFQLAVTYLMDPAG